MKKNLMLLVIAICPTIAACAPCGGFVELAADEVRVDALNEWAHSNVFGETLELERHVFEGGLLVGPGWYTLDLGQFNPLPTNAVDPLITVLRVKPLGSDPLRPTGLFFGERSFEGLIIAKTTLEDLAMDTGYDFKNAVVQSSNAAVICRDD